MIKKLLYFVFIYVLAILTLLINPLMAIRKGGRK